MASKRGYLSQDELKQYADITITDSDEADDQISQAEEIIDTYVGFQEKYFSDALYGKAASGSTTSLVLDNIHRLNYPYKNHFVGLYCEIIGGTNQGLRVLITASDPNGTITTEAFPSAIDSTSLYKIFQHAKFPRRSDVYQNSYETPIAIYKSVPEMVKRAVAAQVEYIVNMGNKYFSTDASERTSESIGDYAYNKGKTNEGDQLIAPKAKMYLRGITNRTGQLLV